MKKHYKSILVIAGFCIVLYTIASFNRYISLQVNDITAVPSQTAESVQEGKAGQESAPKTSQGKMLRIERKSPDGDHTESIVLDNKREVASFKTKDGKIFDESGRIPDGKVKFVYDWTSTYGFEHYRNGKRDGAYTEHYKNGNIKTEAKYQRGRVLKRTTYYQSKALMMEEDFSETRFVSRMKSIDKIDKIGKGKLYRLDGSLKLEWSVVDGSDQHYIKRYNEAGEMTEAHFYDDQGELIEHWTPSQEIPLKDAQMEPAENSN